MTQGMSTACRSAHLVSTTKRIHGSSPRQLPAIRARQRKKTAHLPMHQWHHESWGLLSRIGPCKWTLSLLFLVHPFYLSSDTAVYVMQLSLSVRPLFHRLSL